MKRAHIFSLMALIVAVPAATASSYFASSSSRPCFVSGRAGYEFSGAKSATHIVRIDNKAENAILHMQVVDDPAMADFVLVDDTDAGNACKNVSAIESIRVDPAAAKPSLTVTLSRAPADYKIFVRSANYSEQDAAALFAVIWQNASQTGSIRTSARLD